MPVAAHCYERAAPRAPPIQCARFCFGDAVNHNSQASSCHHVVVFVVDYIQSQTKEPEFQALCCEIALPGAELDEVVQGTWIRSCPELLSYMQTIMGASYYMTYAL